MSGELNLVAVLSYFVFRHMAGGFESSQFVVVPNRDMSGGFDSSVHSHMFYVKCHDCHVR